MTVQELKKQEAALLKSGRENMRQYALAYRDIIKLYNESSDPWLSDDVLLSDSAKKYIKQLEYEYSIRQDDNLKLRAKAASDLFIHKFATKDEITNELKDYVIKDFEHARRILSKSPIYGKIRPETLIEVLKKG